MVNVEAWKPLSKAFFKLNVDVAVDGNGKQIGSDIVVRDEEGIVRLAASLVFYGVFTADIAEAKAFLEELRLTVDRDWLLLLVEFDALNVGAATKQRMN
ncbi:hypothetical protein ACOSQ2_014685 [Xanthoceras sorbifolium]